MPESSAPPALGQINVVVRDMKASLAFYRLLGLTLHEIPIPEWSPHHASGATPNGVQVELDSVAFAKQWNPGLDQDRGAIPFFQVPSREDVDRVHQRLVGAGHRSQQAPEDAFWGARYAIVEDPGGNPIGLISAIDEAKRRPPPPPPPPAISSKDLREVHHLSVSIDRPPAEVYAFAADPKNLPRWARGLAAGIDQIDGEWVADAPMGRVRVRFAAPNAFGVLDHEVTLPTGEVVHNPMRVLPRGAGSEVVFTLFRRPGVTDPAFAADVQAVAQDLGALKRILEHHRVPGRD